MAHSWTILNLYFSRLIGEHRIAQQFVRRCKDKTCFRLRSQAADEFFRIGRAFSPQTKAYLVKEYGDDLDVIYNEKYAEAIAAAHEAKPPGKKGR